MAAEQRFQILQVHARAESFARAGYDEHERVGCLHFFQRGQQIVNQLEADGVTLLGTIESDGRDARVVGKLNGLVHVAIPVPIPYRRFP